MYDPNDLSSAIRQAAESFDPPFFDPRSVVKGGRQRLLRRAAAVTASVAAISLMVLLPLPGIDIDSWLHQRETRGAQRSPVQLQDWSGLPDAPLGPRQAPVSLSTGSGLIIWGGSAGNRDLTDGALYDLETQRWQMLPKSPLQVSGGRTGVWTGTEMILWGGEFGDGRHDAPDTGAAYNPATRTWRTLPRSPYWSLAGHSAVWTGEEMLVWGGVTPGQEGGAAYNPASDRWRSLAPAPIDSRHGHVAVWTGEEMIVWGGIGQVGGEVNDGASFDPGADAWTTLPASPLSPATGPLVTWNGDEMLVVGGLRMPEASPLGAAYDPSNQRWREIESSPVPVSDLSGSSTSIGRDLVLVAPEGIFSYSPRADSWTEMDAPTEAHRRGSSTAIVANRLIVWGGRLSDGGETATGWSARYE